MENFDVTNLSQDVLRSIEADSFWCMSKLLDGIQVSLWGHRNVFALTGVVMWLSPLPVWVSILSAPALERFCYFTELNLLVKSWGDGCCGCPDGPILTRELIAGR